jgi:hypothetical protein
MNICNGCLFISDSFNDIVYVSGYVALDGTVINE